METHEDYICFFVKTPHSFVVFCFEDYRNQRMSPKIKHIPMNKSTSFSVLSFFKEHFFSA